MNSRYFKHCNGIFVNNYLLTGNKVQLYFTEMNSRYFKHCNGIFVNNYLLTGNKVQLYFTEMNSRYFIFRAKRELIVVIPNYIFILSTFLLQLSSYKNIFNASFSHCLRLTELISFKNNDF